MFHPLFIRLMDSFAIYDIRNNKLAEIVSVCFQ